MPNPPESGGPQQRYEVIEKAYCQGRWSLVIEAGTVFLRDLTEAKEEPESKALFHRTQLLIAHTLLHGYGDRQAAEDVYEEVRRSDAEPALRQIAEDGLDQCHQPQASSFEELEREREREEDSAAMTPKPLLFLPEEEGSTPGEEAAQEPARSSAKLSYKPRQPLARPAAVPASGTAPSGPTGTVESIDLGLASDPFRPASGEPPGSGGEATEPVMPWLAAIPSRPAASEPVEAEPPWGGPEAIHPPEGALALVPDVVEEPELMEVHQATPSLAEEVDLVVQSRAFAREGRGGASEADPDRDLRTCLLLVQVN